VIAFGGGWIAIKFLGRDSSTLPSPSSQVGIKSDSSSVIDEENINVRVPLTPVNMQSVPEQPHIIYGTAWKKDDTADLVYDALHAGFRYIDTACQPKHYDEPGVGYLFTNEIHIASGTRST
jgi:hypothetical protein